MTRLVTPYQKKHHLISQQSIRKAVFLSTPPFLFRMKSLPTYAFSVKFVLKENPKKVQVSDVPIGDKIEILKRLDSSSSGTSGGKHSWEAF